MERCLPRAQQDVDRARFVHLDRDLLATREQIVFRERIHVRHGFHAVAAGDEAHASVLDRSRREGVPRRDFPVSVESPVVQILMPAHVALRARLLDEEAAAPYEHVGTDDLRDGFDEPRMPDQPSERRQQLRRITAEQRKPCAIACELRLRRFEVGDEFGGFAFAGHVVRKEEAVTLIGGRHRRGHAGERSMSFMNVPPPADSCRVSHRAPRVANGV